MASSALQLPQRLSSAISDDCAIASRLNASAEAAMGDTELAAWWAARVDDNERRPAAPAAPKKTKYDVFINHRGVDTKLTFAGFLYDEIERLSGGRVRSFMDNRSMRPGDKLQESIDQGIEDCKVAVAIFSKRYFESDFCLFELADIVEKGKLLIPIFFEIKPSELVLPQEVVDSNTYSPQDIERFRKALTEAKHTVGLTYDHDKDDMRDLVSKAANAVIERIQEMEPRVAPRQMIHSRM